MIVMKIITRELRASLPLKFLYADDLILIANSEERLYEKKHNGNQRWKPNV